MANAGKGFLGLLDMIDGGGMGQSGSKFEGGPISGFLNALGVRPHGYMDRLSAVRPEMRPAGLGAAAPMRPVSRSDGYSLEPFGGAGPDVMTGRSLDPFGGPGPDVMTRRNAMSPLERFGGQPPNSSPMAPSYGQMPYEVGNEGYGMDDGSAGTGKQPLTAGAFLRSLSPYELDGFLKMTPSQQAAIWKRWASNGGRF